MTPKFRSGFFIDTTCDAVVDCVARENVDLSHVLWERLKIGMVYERAENDMRLMQGLGNLTWLGQHYTRRRRVQRLMCSM